MKRIIAGTMFAGAIAAGVAITAGPADADNGVIHVQGTATDTAPAPGASAEPDATAIEYGLAAKSGGGVVHADATATRPSR